MADSEDFIKEFQKIADEERLGKNEDYFVSKQAQSDGDHEIHTSSCSDLPAEKNRKYLGCFNFCKDAEQEAKKYYEDVNGCIKCCPLCHARYY